MSKRARALRTGLDPDFHQLLLRLSKTTSLSLQHSLVSAEVQALRLTMAASPQAKPRDLVRAIFCEMMGFDTADFAHLQAIILCQNAKNLYEKRLAYLAVSIFLSGRSSLGLLLVNTLQRDLSSANPIEVAMALSVVSTVATPDLIPTLAQYVHRSLSNESELVRRKAVIVFARFHALDPLLVAPYIKALKQTVADPHPSVMSASLVTLCAIVRDAAPPRAKFKSLAPALVHVLEQILEHRLDASYTYHGIPAPFVQINCMRLLSLLDGLAAEVEETVVMTVLNGLHRVGNMQQGNIAYMVLLQCVQTLASRPSAQRLMPHVWHVIASLLKSDVESDLLAGLDCLESMSRPKHDAIQPEWHQQPHWQQHHHTIRSEAQPILWAICQAPALGWPVKLQALDVLLDVCNDAALAGSIVPILLDAMQPIQDNAFLQKAYMVRLTDLVHRYMSQDASSANKTLLDAFERVADPCRTLLTPILTERVKDGRLPRDVAIGRAQQWLANADYPSNQTWLAAWIAGHVGHAGGSQQTAVLDQMALAISTLAGVPGIHGSPNMDMDAELVAHLIEMASKLAAAAGVFPKSMSDAVERLRECTHVGVAHRARMYLDSANTLIQA